MPKVQYWYHGLFLKRTEKPSSPHHFFKCLRRLIIFFYRESELMEDFEEMEAKIMEDEVKALR